MCKIKLKIILYRFFTISEDITAVRVIIQTASLSYCLLSHLLYSASIKKHVRLCLLVNNINDEIEKSLIMYKVGYPLSCRHE